ncbi:L-asparaginase [Halopelagius inordinatus]|uniref:L-asparaginase n=1 Tax=Halopelagius inordinatus TaxID=553467 RepID=A0A1I2SFY3_9EURY|nr:asparaginase [Halopelagius inordinatus]SFG51745.1 L-asparaginase [Halopelagius inordinatus]
MPKRRTFLKLTGAVGGGGLLADSSVAKTTEEVLSRTETPSVEEQPEVRVIGTGGTIASTEGAADDGGYDLSERAEAIVGSVPVLDEFVDISYEQVAQKGSSSLLVEDYVNVAKAARQAERDGADGVVVTHGTDAIEEDAYFNDLVLDLDIPVAFVGAQRAADAVSADGPSNLVTAARLITRREFHLKDEPSGVYVVLNETVHAARDVTKTHTTKLETFDSGPAGPIAVFTDNQLVLYRDPGSYSADLSDSDLDAMSDLTVPIATTGAGADAYLIEQAVAGKYDVDGIVIQATGWWGGIAPEMDDATEAALEKGIPVARSTRVHWGPMNPGYDPEPDSIVVMADLPAWKARLHVIAALPTTDGLGDTETQEAIRDTIKEGGQYGKGTVAPSTL